MQLCWAVGEAQGGSGRQHCSCSRYRVRWRQELLGVRTLLSRPEGGWGLGGVGGMNREELEHDGAVLCTHRRFDAGCGLLALVGLAWMDEV